MFGFVGDSTDSAPVAEVSPDAADATQVYWPESEPCRSVTTKIRPFNFQQHSTTSNGSSEHSIEKQQE